MTAGGADDELARSLRGFVEEVGHDGAREALRDLELGARDDADLVGLELGEFRLLRRIARGGMGTVFEAEQGSVPGRRVAVKVLHGAGASPSRLLRFEREVEVIGRLSHRCIVPILGADLSGPVPFYAMQLVGGRTLRDELGEGTLDAGDFGRIARMFRGLADALQHAHEQGVVHRDVNPRNVLIEPDGRALLVDFGLAYDELADSELTRSGDSLGTSDYMAPEQISTRFGPITAATDVFGLGATLYECLTGRRPFRRGSRHETLTRILEGDPDPIARWNPSVPADLRTICMKALEKLPARRYATPGAMGEDLDRFLRFQPILATRPGVLGRMRGWRRRHRLVADAALIGVLVFAASTIYWKWIEPRSRAAELVARVALLEERRASGLDRARVLYAELERRRNLPFAGEGGGRLSELGADLGGLGDDLQGIDREIDRLLDQALRQHSSGSAVRRAAAAYHARRLEESLRNLDAVFDPGLVALWEERLAAQDDGAHAELLDRRGVLSITCPQGPAVIHLCERREESDGRLLFDPPSAGNRLGEAPLESIEIQEGSYRLVARLPGYEDTLLPILVRRRAIQGPRERSIEIPLHTREEIGAGFRFVPGGFSIIGPRRESPVDFARRFVHVEGFFIAEREAAWDDLERFGVDLTQFEGLGRDAPLGEVGGLVHNLNWGTLFACLDPLNAREARTQAEPAWLYRLPSAREWERAGRGADGRVYPWGNVYDPSFAVHFPLLADANYWRHDVERWPEEDVSPFLVRDLAGSLREPCRPSDWIRRSRFNTVLLRGGWLDARTPAEISLLSEDQVGAENAVYFAGLRLVKVALPPLGGEEEPLPFHEAFQGPDRPFVSGDGGWTVELSDGTPIDEAERAWIRDEKLVLWGLAGHFTPRLRAWHRVVVPARSFRASAVLSTRHGSYPGRGGTQAVSLVLGDRPAWMAVADCFALEWSPDPGTLRLSAGRGMHVHSDVQLDGARPHRLELEVDARRARAWIHPAGSPRPKEPALALDLPADGPVRPIRYVAIGVGNFKAVRAEVEEIRVEPLGP